MIVLIIIFGVLFTAGNIVWPYFNEPKLFYVPLAVFIWLLIVKLMQVSEKEHEVKRYFITWLFLLASGNVVKQIFYTDRIKQINDYAWGGLCTLVLIIMIIRWAILGPRSGGKN